MILGRFSLWTVRCAFSNRLAGALLSAVLCSSSTQATLERPAGMRITSFYHGTKKVWQTSESEVIFGRAEEKLSVTLDLSPDLSVSRVHGRIWQMDGSCWIEDLDSSGGTFLNGNEIK